ncbi:VIT1/CCC1 transporter family protein [Alicyclobacillus mengziensis]|uniref:VIT1/CCC1 transporter family protein n=1 Tax=Alicyclobacillus mengziensis TaxID=2931921 RepID=UPI002010F067|nr:VIT1/CCC1 transporter family protein [Alicyclobacillus mengziensis]
MAHQEEHFEAPDSIRDIVIGMSDGLTVPFALAAGLSGAVSTTTLVVVAGLAEIAAGSIAMGLGGYLAAKTDEEHYESELERERTEVTELPDREREEVVDILKEWGVSDADVDKVTNSICADKHRWVDFMMKFELGLERPEAKRARNSSLTIGVSYIAGGLIPLFPYMIIHRPLYAQLLSVVVTLIALFVFGFVKGRFTGQKAGRSAIQTTVVGGLAAAFAFAVAKLIQ